MNGKTANRIKHLAGTVLAAATLAGAGATQPARDFYCSAAEFVGYYQELGDSSVQAGFLERVAISLTLTKVEASRRAQTRCAIL